MSAPYDDDSLFRERHAGVIILALVSAAVIAMLILRGYDWVDELVAALRRFVLGARRTA